MWEVHLTDEFQEWFMDLTESLQIDVLTAINLLQARGPNLARPYSDSVKGSKVVSNLKELRIQHAGTPYRVLYCFNTSREAVLLCGDRKDGRADKSFYPRVIRIAENQFVNYLKSTGLN
ncbi:type II toxin-antitoxin system RelE/ParE family toxin [Aequoribacter sp.]|jgi:hypothetical protein|uniref:type II toxin-antitoxin system RelE/ParE family toxin n=2 Tax=Aequoribacter sp. TaxID=2847771 RepID=UPI003C4A9C76